MRKRPIHEQNLAAFRLGETHCLCITSNLDAITASQQNLMIIPGTKPYFLGSAKIGRDLVYYFDLPSFLGLSSERSKAVDDYKATTFVLTDPLSTAIYGLQTDEILPSVPSTEIEDARREDMKIPAKLTPFCAGVVKAHGRLWALIYLEKIVQDPNFRAVELPVKIDHDPNLSAVEQSARGNK